ncbi:hypothetical protein [Amycolatopsis sp. lyj-108]|uniref:hypothetical protein n=1 Tax=Amycolatopsis sp. lyj-108 TaxID=2789286 RepID=UPI00397D225F
MTGVTTRPHTMAGRRPVPAGRAILLAFEFAPEDSDPVLGAAHLLAVLHLARADVVRSIGDADDTITAAAARAQEQRDQAIAGQVALIDEHVAICLPSLRRGSVHTETVGALLARLAQRWQHWHELAALPAADPRARDAFSAVAELARAYDDLIDDVLFGRRRLPRYQHPDPHGKA